MFSSIKFKENGKKRIMTVPSNWIVGDSLCWPNNNKQVNTLFRKMADPQDSWKQIQITRQLYEGIILFIEIALKTTHFRHTILNK